MSMVEERTCDFTGQSIEPGTGIMYVRADGTVLHFVDSKAEKNYLKGREARDLKWTGVGRPEPQAATTTDEPEPADSADEVDEDDADLPPDVDESTPESSEAVEEGSDEAEAPSTADEVNVEPDDAAVAERDEEQEDDAEAK